jgi:hypothetical protein
VRGVGIVCYPAADGCPLLGLLKLVAAIRVGQEVMKFENSFRVLRSTNPPARSEEAPTDLW